MPSSRLCYVYRDRRTYKLRDLVAHKYLAAARLLKSHENAINDTNAREARVSGFMFPSLVLLREASSVAHPDIALLITQMASL